MTGQSTELLDRLRELTLKIKLAAERRDGESLPDLVNAYLEASAIVTLTPLETSSPEEIQRWKTLAVELLQLQRDVELIASPWMDDLRILLRENRKGQALSNTYRTES